MRFFESEVRPLIAAKCQKCHGPRQQRGGLRLDSRSALLKGGKTGPAVVPGKVDESLLIEAVNYESLEMPPDGPLSSREIAILSDWVKRGAPWPEPTASRSAGEPGRISDEDRAYWAFQPLATPAAARGRRRRLVAKSDRSVHRGQAGRGGASPGPRGRSACLDPPRVVRPDGTAARWRPRSTRSWPTVRPPLTKR